LGGWLGLSIRSFRPEPCHVSSTTPYGAIRAGDFKLIEFFDDMRVELYNLREDIGEQRNLAAQMPKKADELRGRCTPGARR
jgi:hypothetical protein